jgi:hypothetical protein
MPTFELEESDYSGPIDDDTLMTAEIVKISIEEKKYREEPNDPNSPFVKKLVWKFVLQDPDGSHDGDTIYGETGLKFNNHPDCKLKNWAQETMATEFPLKYRLDTDILLNKQVRVVIGHRTYEKDGQTKDHNFVKDVIRTADNMSYAGAGQF